MTQGHVDGSGGRAVRAGLGYTVGNILIKGIAFVSIPIFSHLLTKEDYGAFNTYAAYVSIFAVIISLGLPTSVRTARYDFRERLHEYSSNCATLILLSLAVFTLAGGLWAQDLQRIGGIRSNLVLLAVFASFGTAMLSLYNNLLSLEYRSREYLSLSLFYSAGSVILSVLLIKLDVFHAPYFSRALGNTLPMLIIAGYILVRLLRRARPRIQKEYTRYGLRFGLPLIPHDLSQLVLSQFDRVMIVKAIGEAEAGLFSFACNLGLPVQVLSVSFETAWTPWLFERLQEKDYASIRNRTALFSGIISCLVMMLMLISPELISLLAPAEYSESRYVAVPVILSMYFAFLYVFPAGLEYYLKKTQYIAAGTMSVAVLDVILNVYFIRRCGYVAAAYTTLFCYVVYYVFHTLIARRLFGRYVVESKRFFAAMAATSAVAALCLACMKLWYLRWALALALSAGGLVLILRHRQAWLPLLRTLPGRKGKAGEPF